MSICPTIAPKETLAELAVSHAGASRVFYRHGLDFCCHGQISLEDACEKSSIELSSLIAELEREAPQSEHFERWDQRPFEEIIEHILHRYHERHREELPRLISMASKVESVHGDKDSCPKGLTVTLECMRDEMEPHMQKEEQILFPMILAGQGRMAVMPIQAMEHEHRDLGENLIQLSNVANEFVPPDEACGTWRALYLGLAELDSDLKQHIHLENNILFPRALES